MVNMKSNNEIYSKLIRNSIKIPTPIYKPNFTLASNVYSIESYMKQISQLGKINFLLPNINLQLEQMVKDFNTLNIENISSMVKAIYNDSFINLNQLTKLTSNINYNLFSNELAESIYSFNDSLKEFCNENNIVNSDIDSYVSSIDSTKETFENSNLSKSDILNIINIVVTLLFFVYGLYSNTQSNISNEHMTKTIQQNTETNIKLTKELEKLNSNLKNLSSED